MCALCISMVLDKQQTLLTRAQEPKRNSEGPFLFSIDHCFGIKGQGTVMTGMYGMDIQCWRRKNVQVS